MNYHTKGLRLVALETDLDGDTATNIHVVRVNLRNSSVSATACGIKGKSGYAFPFHKWIWESNTAPICEACYQKVGGRIRQDTW